MANKKKQAEAEWSPWRDEHIIFAILLFPVIFVLTAALALIHIWLNG